MVDQSMLTSGFDLELLLGERYIKYFLLTSFETGSIPWWTQDVNPATGATITIIVHPPQELRTNRLYAPHPDFVPQPFIDIVNVDYTQIATACDVALLPSDSLADIRVQLVVSVIGPPLLPGGEPFVLSEQRMFLDARFFVIADIEPATGFQRNARFRLEIVDIGGPLIALADSLPPQYGWNKAATLANLKDEIDREVPLGIVGDGGAIQTIDTIKHYADADHPNALGIYVNLKLKNGPEPDAFVAPRGQILGARNFLPAGEHLAFGFRASMYSLLGADLFQRMAEPKPTAPGEFYYPVKDGDDVVGHLIGASVYPQRTGQGPEAEFANVLVIDVEGEYFVNNWPDPNFHMKIRLVPSFRDGVMTLTPDFDLDVPALDYLIVASVLLSILSLKAALPLTIALVILKAAIEQAGEDQALPAIESELRDASLLESFPNNLTIEERRWDPTYFTQHKIVSLIRDIAVNDQGFAFSGHDLRLDKVPKPVDHAVIRSEVRDDAGNVSGLLYRVRDWGPFLPELGRLFPATDRMDFVSTVPGDTGVERTRVHLTVEQAIARVDSGRLVEKLAYSPYKIDERAHQIYQILTLSSTEVPEINAAAGRLLRAELITAHGTEYLAQAQVELLAELGREPTAEELQARFDAILATAVAAGLPQRYRRERERYLKLDLEPFEYARLQQSKILILDYQALEIIKMRNGTVYYRDRPDSDSGDNLRRIPRYRSETIVRV